MRKNYSSSKRFMIHFTVVNAPLPTMNLLKNSGSKESVKIGGLLRTISNKVNTSLARYCIMHPVSDVLTPLDIVCKNKDKICEEFGLDLGHYFSTPHPVIDLILKK